jgi:hypothetical protein
VRQALENASNALISRRRRRLLRRREIEMNDRLETIRQNLQTIEELKQTMTVPVND